MEVQNLRLLGVEHWVGIFRILLLQWSDEWDARGLRNTCVKLAKTISNECQAKLKEILSDEFSVKIFDNGRKLNFVWRRWWWESSPCFCQQSTKIKEVCLVFHQITIILISWEASQVEPFKILLENQFPNFVYVENPIMYFLWTYFVV